MALTKKDLAADIARKMHLHTTDVERIVQMILDGIIEVLATEGRVELRNFGIYEVTIRKSRKGRNPRTGVEVMIPSRKRVAFKAGKFMTDRVNDRVKENRRKAGGELWRRCSR